MAYTYKQRSDKGFDFFNGNQKVTIDDYTKATGANKNQLVQQLASAGDVVSQRAVRQLPSQFSAASQPRLSGQAQANKIASDKLLAQSKADVFNPFKVANDIGKAGADFGNAVGRFATDTVNNFGNRVADAGEAGAVAIREFTGQNAADFNTNQQFNNTNDSARKSIVDALRRTSDPTRRNQLIDSYKRVNAGRQSISSGHDQQVNQQLAATDPRKTLTNAAETVLDVATAGKGAALLSGIKSTAAPVTREALKQLAINAAKTTGQGALVGGSYGGVNTARDPNATLQDYAKNIGTGAIVGAGVGLGAQVALPVASKALSGAVKAPGAIANRAIESSPKYQASQHPDVLGHDAQYSDLGKQFDTTTDPVARRQISQAMAENRMQRLQTQRRVERQISQRGSIQVPGGQMSKKPSDIVSNISDGEKVSINGKDYTYKTGTGITGKTEEFLYPDKAYEDYLVVNRNDGKTTINSIYEGDKPIYSFNAKPTSSQVPGGKAPDVPTTRAYGREIEMTEANGYKPTTTADGGVVYAKVNRTGSNAKGTQLTSYYYDVKGNKITQAQAEAMVDGRLASTAPQVTKTPKQPTQFEQALQDAGIAPTTQKTPIEQVPTAKNRFTEGVQNSPEVSKEVAGQLKNITHDVRNTEQLVADVQNQIKTEGVEPSLNRTLQELDAPSGAASDETLARAIELAKHHDSLGTPEAQAMAANLYDKVTEQAIGKGRGVQILSLLARRSPAGLRNKALRDLKKAGVEITPKITKEVQDHIDAISKIPEGELRDYAIAVFQKAVAKHIPQGVVNNLVSVWKAGLLSGVKTQQGNLISNATFGALKKLSDPLAIGIDKVISLGTKERTVGLTNKGIISGTGKGAKEGWGTIKTGIDKRDFLGEANKYEQHAEINFGNPVVQTILGAPSNFIFRTLKASDQPFYYAALKNSMYDQAKALGINKGLKGKSLMEFMDETVKNPPENLMTRAVDEANKSVLNFDTFASKAVSGMKRGIDQLPGATKAQKAAAHAVIDFLAPFTKIPTAFLARTIDFTPLGIGKEIIDQVAHKTFDQRSLAKAISEGITGTGMIALGIALSNADMLSGQYPTDPKEQALWKAQKKTANSIKLGDTWYSLNYLGPLGLLFRTGQGFNDSMKRNGNVGEAIGQGIAGLGGGLMDQSFLQGFTGFSDAIKDPERNLMSFVKSFGGSFVPAWSNDIANATDSMQRQVNDVVDAVKNRIPGARQTLTPKVDAFGNDLEQPAGGLNAAFNAFKPSNEKVTPLTTELDRLSKAGQTTFPTPDKSLTVGDETVTLTPEQLNKYTKDSGQAIQDAWSNIIGTPKYETLSDEDKSAYLNNAKNDINAVTKRNTLIELGRQDLADKVKLTGNQKMLAASISAGKGISQYETKSPDATASVTGTKLSETTPSYKLLNSYGNLSKDEQTKWNKEQVSPDYKLLVDNINSALPEGLPKLPETNEVAKLYADFEKNKADNSWSELQTKKESKKLVTDAYKSQLTENEKFISGLSDKEILAAVDSGEITKDEINNVIGLDNILNKLGMSQNISNKTRSLLGYGTLASSSGGKSGSKKKSVSDLLSASNKINETNNSTMKALQSLLAGTTAKSTQPKQIGRKVALNKITVKGA